MIASAQKALDGGTDLSGFTWITIKVQNFTQFSKDNSTVSNSSMADSTIVKMMNLMNYIGTQGTTT